MAKKVYQLNANDAVSQPTDRAALFVSGTAYAVGDFVCYENRIYVCKQTTDGTKLPTDTAYWNDMTYVSQQFTSANTSLVAVCREYGGTQIKQDENGNFYYEVEVED